MNVSGALALVKYPRASAWGKLEKNKQRALALNLKNMAYVNVWIHAVWGTKNHEPILTKEVRAILFQHIKENGKSKGVYVDFINGYNDHVHCLIGLNADLSIAKALQLLKGESSFWANKLKLIRPKLQWADEYYAVSVSESQVNKVREYIKGQEEHHKKKTFTQEYEEFMKNLNSESQG